MLNLTSKARFITATYLQADLLTHYAPSFWQHSMLKTQSNRPNGFKGKYVDEPLDLKFSQNVYLGLNITLTTKTKL